MGNPHNKTDMDNRIDEIAREIRELQRKEASLKRILVTLFSYDEKVPDTLMKEAKRISKTFQYGYDE